MEAGGELLANDHTQAGASKIDKKENGNVPKDDSDEYRFFELAVAF